MKHLLLNSIVLMSAEFSDFSNKLVELLNQFWAPMLAVIGASVAIFAVLILWKFWGANGDEQKIKKAKETVKYFVVGIVLLFVIVAGTPLIMAAFQTWSNS